MYDFVHGIGSLVSCTGFLYFIGAAAFLGISLLVRKIWRF